MFGDVGQGLVLVAAGLVLRRRWPLLDVLVVNGIAATLFGFVFGSVFGREDLVPALWVHPMEQPLPVLQVPLAGGVLVLWLGLMLKALQDRWEGEVGRWWRIEAPQVALYLAVLVMLMWPAAGPAALFALAWYLLGSRLQQRHEPARGMAAAVGSLFENLLQLLINTLSFVRVGAFALAHAGLAQAFTTLADIPEHRLAAFGILLVGNLVIIVLEGLVVTIQTTRLVLFEFFIRFVRAGGRVFCPLAAPAVRADSGGPA
jgi:V/A-type H+-transporting ATPase subunit I